MKRNPNFNCIICGAGGYCPPSRIKKGSGKFCSYKCAGIYKKGKPQQELFVNSYSIPKGNKPWNKGKGWVKGSCPTCKIEFSYLASQKKGFCSAECAYKHMTLDVPTKYGTIHAWVRRKYGKPSLCEHCGTCEAKKFEWANISGRYLLDREDWARLCVTCHRRYDFGVKNKIEELSSAYSISR